MSLSSSFTSDTTSDASHLRQENELLRQELHQSKADKEFVWSLWKRLQVTNPDVTSAISDVLERKNEECAVKEKSFLKASSEKDFRINDLEEKMALQGQDIKSHLTRKLELQRHVEELQLELKDCLTKINGLQKQVKEFELRDAESTSRDVVRQLDGLNLELKQQLHLKDAELAQLRLRNNDLVTTDSCQHEKISNMDAAIRSVKEENDGLNSDLSKLRMICRKFEDEIQMHRREMEIKDAEAEKLRRELAETWQVHRQSSECAMQQTELNRRLQSLLTDTQKMLQNQEESFAVGISSQKQRLLEQDGLIADLQKKLQTAEEEMRKTKEQSVKKVPPGDDVAFENEELQHNRSTQDGATSPLRFRVNQSPGGTLATDDLYYREEILFLQQKLDGANRKMSDCKNLLVMKNKELEALRSALARRLERLRSLLNSNRLMKKQLRLFHEDPVSVVTKRISSTKTKSQTKKMQKEEDTDCVWNELDNLRKENKNLKAENIRLMEESDVLKIESANCTTTIHELTCCLEDQKREIRDRESERDKYKVQNKDLYDDASSAKFELDKVHLEMSDAMEEVHRLRADLEISQEENGSLSSDLHFLQEQDKRQKSRLAFLQKDILQLRRNLRKRPSAHHVNSKISSSHSKQKKSQSGREDQKESEEAVDFHRSNELADSDIERTTRESDRRALLSSFSSSQTSGTGHSLGHDIVRHSRTVMASVDDRECGGEPVREATTKPDQKNRAMLTSRQKAVIKKYVLSLTKEIMQSQQNSSIHDQETEQTVLQVEAMNRNKGCDLRKMQSSKRVASLKQRIATLQHQVNILKMSKESALRLSEQQGKDLNSLQEKFNSCNQKLISSKALAQRLTGEVDRLKSEKESWERKMSEYTFEASTCSGRPDQEWISLQNRLKSATTTLSKQLDQIKQLRVENRKQQEKITQLNQRYLISTI